MTKTSFKRWMHSTTVIVWCVGLLLTEEGSTLRNSWAGESNVGPLQIYVVAPISRQMILPDTFPIPGERTSTIKISACRGEFEPASFVLRAIGLDMAGVTLTATDLRSVSSNAVIPSKHIDLKIVKPWFQSYYAWNEIWKGDAADFRQTLVPELLLKDDALVKVELSAEQNFVKLNNEYVWINQKQLVASEQALPTMPDFPIKDAKTLQPFAIDRDTNKQVWVTILVSLGTPPDKYSGEIAIRSNGVLQGTINVDLEVHSFELAESKITHSIYYRAVLDNTRASVGSEYRNTEQMREELQNLISHGVRNPTMYQPLSNQKLLREALQIRQDLGMNNGPLYYLGVQTTASFLGKDAPQSENRLRTIFSQVNGLARASGFTSVHIYGKDEAKGEALVAQRRLWDIVHGLGGKIIVAGYTDSFGLVGDLLDTVVFHGRPSQGEAIKWHNIGHQIFSYQNPQSGPENPFLFRLNYGLVLWANDFDGAMPYAYQHCFGSCWNDMDHPKYRDHTFTYPTADGVIDTLAWEGFREATDDVRYLTTLEKVLSNGSINITPAVNEARLFLSTLKTTLLSKQKNAGKYNSSMEIDLDEIRGKVIMHINTIVQSIPNSPPASPRIW
jgi:hypothetical protein